MDDGFYKDLAISEERKGEVQNSDVWIEFKKDIYHTEYLQSLGLSDRQVKAVLFAKENGKITNKEYQEISKTSAKTAVIDIDFLVNKNIFKRKGERKGVFYEVANGVNGV